MLLEACVETLDQAQLAESSGAHRLELCDDLSVGGLTPSMELLRSVKAAVALPIMAMVRPRAGGFVCSETEFEEMKQTIDAFKAADIQGVVFGLLLPDGNIDLEKTAALAAYAFPMEVTFHKAIDDTPDPVAAVRQLLAVPNIQRVLTSGGAETALLGQNVLKEMIATVGEGLTILTAGRVTKENLAEVHSAIGAREYHGRRIVF